MTNATGASCNDDCFHALSLYDNRIATYEKGSLTAKDEGASCANALFADPSLIAPETLLGEFNISHGDLVYGDFAD